MNLSSTRRRLTAAGLMTPWALSATTARAQPRSMAPVAGKDYIEVKPPQPPENAAGRVEVIEFFWYGCPACFAFEPLLEPWRKRLPAEIEYRRVPVAFDANRTPHSRIYYALETMKRLDDLHRAVFNAIHVNKRRLIDPNEIAEFMAANGVDRKQWTDTFNSFTVATRATRAAQIWGAYKLDGTPALAVDGRYMTSPAQAGDPARALLTADFLIDRALAERGSKKK